MSNRHEIDGQVICEDIAAVYTPEEIKCLIDVASDMESGVIKDAQYDQGHWDSCIAFHVTSRLKKELRSPGTWASDKSMDLCERTGKIGCGIYGWGFNGRLPTAKEGAAKIRAYLANGYI